MCEVSESTVGRMIKVLVARKLVTIERRFNQDGSCRSNGYWLAIDHVAKPTALGVDLAGRGVNLTGGPPSSAPEGGVNLKGGGVTGDPITTIQPVFNKVLRRCA